MKVSSLCPVNDKPVVTGNGAQQSDVRPASEPRDTTALWSAWAAAGSAHSAATTAYFRWQRALDLALAALLLIPSLPIIGLLVVLVRATSRGPGIYRQIRVGKHGRTFWMYKIRSMRQDAEAGTGAVWAQQRDPRVTPIGRVLRKLHLDEVPQVFNVLQGEMSFIGPRPERPEFVHVLAKQIPDYLG
jgi:lipopolysaccharide/colanic/teichoic acid biosynthesis glycosyltransferase